MNMHEVQLTEEPRELIVDWFHYSESRRELLLDALVFKGKHGADPRDLSAPKRAGGCKNRYNDLCRRKRLLWRLRFCSALIDDSDTKTKHCHYAKAQEWCRRCRKLNLECARLGKKHSQNSSSSKEKPTLERLEAYLKKRNYPVHMNSLRRYCYDVSIKQGHSYQDARIMAYGWIVVASEEVDDASDAATLVDQMTTLGIVDKSEGHTTPQAVVALDNIRAQHNVGLVSATFDSGFDCRCIYWGDLCYLRLDDQLDTTSTTHAVTLADGTVPNAVYGTVTIQIYERHTGWRSTKLLVI